MSDRSKRVNAPPLVVLAAGRGRRLAPLTDETHKCLLPVGGVSALGRLLDWVRHRLPRELVIVTGHARERVWSFVEEAALPVPIRQVINAEYTTTNNLYSASLVRRFCGDGFVLVNSDVICHPAILDLAVEAALESFLILDPRRPPREEAMKVQYRENRLTAIGKHLDPRSSDGEYIGIARFDASGARVFFERAEALLARGGHGEWYEAAIGESAALVPIRGRSTGNLPWIEIDEPDDLLRAENDILPQLSSFPRHQV